VENRSIRAYAGIVRHIQQGSFHPMREGRLQLTALHIFR